MIQSTTIYILHEFNVFLFFSIELKDFLKDEQYSNLTSFFKINGNENKQKESV